MVLSPACRRQGRCDLDSRRPTGAAGLGLLPGHLSGLPAGALADSFLILRSSRDSRQQEGGHRLGPNRDTQDMRLTELLALVAGVIVGVWGGMLGTFVVCTG